VAVEYAVVIGTLAAAISLTFAGLGGRLVEKLTLLPI
jgi:Flp pilus assembly pilin Flp